MKPRYAIVDTQKRDDFEREWHLPFGYGNTIVSCDLELLIEDFNELDRNENHVIEKYDNGVREVVYPQ